jgi:2-keto-4-pentenoate hydratase/2-oxohepta-3-ene-1,7-dioic acid hydratase in catechol pathway
MKFASYRSTDGGSRYGIVDGEWVFDLTTPERPTLKDFLALSGRDAAAACAAATRNRDAAIPLRNVRLAPVIEQPGKIVCLGLNYVEHAREGGYEIPSYPALFMRVASSLVANGDPIVRPRASDKLDYEAELAVVIGRRGRHISEADALKYVAGYTVFNDASVRDYQRRSAQWTAGKNFDGTGALGPYLVTPDELPVGAAGLHIESRLNGRVMQSSTTADMIFGVPKTIEILSEVMTLDPGDVIAMGTPPGVGHARKPPVWMRDGDTVEIEIERIGVLRNPVRDEAAEMAEARP